MTSMEEYAARALHAKRCAKSWDDVSSWVRDEALRDVRAVLDAICGNKVGDKQPEWTRDVEAAGFHAAQREGLSMQVRPLIVWQAMINAGRTP